MCEEGEPRGRLKVTVELGRTGHVRGGGRGYGLKAIAAEITKTEVV